MAKPFTGNIKLLILALLDVRLIIFDSVELEIIIFPREADNDSIFVKVPTFANKLLTFEMDEFKIFIAPIFTVPFVGKFRLLDIMFVTYKLSTFEMVDPVIFIDPKVTFPAFGTIILHEYTFDV